MYVIERSLGATLFSCADYTPNEPFIVEAGDIVGACVFNPSGGSNEQLDIVGNRLTSLGILMRTGDNGCDINAVPSSINSASLEDSSTLALHLYANFIGNTHNVFISIVNFIPMQYSIVIVFNVLISVLAIAVRALIKLTVSMISFTQFP